MGLLMINYRQLHFTVCKKTTKMIRPGYDWYTITIQHFATVIAAANFDTLIDKNNIHSKYEIYVAIMGITFNRSGIDSYAITPDKSFTNDLGID
jgi:hypothetical protein